jgi:RNA polymerase-binding transcription factor DksA
MRARTDTSAWSRLETQLDGIVRRLHGEGDLPQTAPAGGEFLDVAQSLQQQELAGLIASRLAERARRLRIALTRLEDGEYGVCSDCGTPIAPKRLAALPDTTTCLACQERLERVAPR